MEAAVQSPEPIQYKKLSMLGSGGLAEVWLGEIIRDGRDTGEYVAVKQLKEPEKYGHVLKRELHAHQRMKHRRHPNLLEVLGHEDNGLITEVVKGVRIEKYLSKFKMGERILQALQIAAQISDGIEAMHAEGFIHQDLKPENMLVEELPDGTPLVKVLDFGCAREMAQPKDEYILGTPAFMSPEQVRGEKLDARSDIYALGAILYEMMLSCPLYVLTKADAGSELTAVCLLMVNYNIDNDDAVATLNYDLRLLLSCMLAFDRERRPESMKVVGEIIRSLMVKLQAPVNVTLEEITPMPVPPPLPVPRYEPDTIATSQYRAIPVAMAPIPAPPAPPRPRPVVASRRVLTLVAGMLLGMLSAALFLLVRSGAHHTSTTSALHGVEHRPLAPTVTRNQPTTPSSPTTDTIAPTIVAVQAIPICRGRRSKVSYHDNLRIAGTSIPDRSCWDRPGAAHKRERICPGLVEHFRRHPELSAPELFHEFCD